MICEEKWVGSKYDGTKDIKEDKSNADFGRDNPLPQKAAIYGKQGLVAVSPSASPPSALKGLKHELLDSLGSKYAEVFIDTDGLGSSGSSFAQFGGRYVAQNGSVVSKGKRLSMDNLSYNETIVEVNCLDTDKAKPHTVVPHQFRDKHLKAQNNGPATWDDISNPRQAFEEELRMEIVWLKDYMRKTERQGFIQALSGGADSAYNSVKVRLMIDLSVEELGFEGFMKQMEHLKYKDEALKIYQEKGLKDAGKFLMDNMLTCVYMGTENSSFETSNAARTLIEGGADEHGNKFEGIGGRFFNKNIQPIVETYANAYAMNASAANLTEEQHEKVTKELKEIFKLTGNDVSAQELSVRVDILKSQFEGVVGDVLSYADKSKSVAIENIQARVRQVLVLVYTNTLGGTAMANPNLDEARNSYATYGGDLHSGMIGPNAHKPKQRELDQMGLLYEFGLEGIEPIKALNFVNKNKPSAELLPSDIQKNDEDALGRTFDEMNRISTYMLADRPKEQSQRKNNPTEVYNKCRKDELFKNISDEDLHDKIRISYERFYVLSQFKIHASPIAATFGESVDHQVSLRTPNVSSCFKPELAQLAIDCLKYHCDKAGKDFKRFTGVDHSSLRERVLLDKDMANKISDIMYDASAADGKPRKLNKLIKHIENNKGLGSLISQQKPNPLAEMISQANAFRKQNGLSA